MNSQKKLLSLVLPNGEPAPRLELIPLRIRRSSSKKSRAPDDGLTLNPTSNKSVSHDPFSCSQCEKLQQIFSTI